jgi:predicted ATPase
MPMSPTRLSWHLRVLLAELKRRHVFRVGGVYAIVAWLLIQIADTVFPHLDLPEWTISLVIVLTVLGFPVALVLAWALEITPQGVRRTPSGSPAEADGDRDSAAQAPTAKPSSRKARAEEEFRPASAAATPIVLPTPPTALVGREQEVRELREDLLRGGIRLVTLTGAGGTGKTRLALQVAADLGERFADGVFFVNLAPITDPALVPAAIAQTLGVREAGERPLVETLPEFLREKHLLLLLDNFEHITEAAPFVGRILAAAPNVKVLVTSRVRIHLGGEHEHVVPPLSLPDPRHLPPVDKLAQYEAVRLFVERARQVRKDFSVTAENASAIAEICHRLDGLPLAIELAAARVKVLSPRAMLARLQSRLELLTGGARDLPERQQTLRGTIEWSYDLLSTEEKVLFRRLTVFSGGRTLEAVEVVCNPNGELDVLEGVTSLLNKSLLRQADASVEPRFVMLNTIREFAREKLRESGETDDLRRRHAEFFRTLAEQAEPHLTGPEQSRWLGRLEAEHENFRIALRWALERGAFELAAQLAGVLPRLWEQRGHYQEGRQWLREILAADGLAPVTRAKALFEAGYLAWRQLDFGAAELQFERSLALSRELEDAPGIARALNGLAAMANQQGDVTRAESLYREAADRWRELGHKRGTALVANNLGGMAAKRGEYARAEALFEESLALAREAEDLALVGVVLHNLGNVAYNQGNHRRARTLLWQGLEISREARYVQLAVDCLELLAEVASRAGEWERAAYLFGAAEARFAAIGTHLEPAAREEYESALAAARAQLDEGAWQRAYREGAAMSLEEAIDYALQEEPTALSS